MFIRDQEKGELGNCLIGAVSVWHDEVLEMDSGDGCIIMNVLNSTRLNT